MPCFTTAEQIYKGTDERGIVTFSDAPLPNMKDQQTFNISIPSEDRDTLHSADRKQVISNIPLSADTIDAINNIKPFNKTLQRQQAKKAVLEAYQNVNRATRKLQQKITAWQSEVSKLNNLLPGQQQEVEIQQIKVDMAKQAVQDAKLEITNAEKILEVARNSQPE